MFTITNVEILHKLQETMTGLFPILSTDWFVRETRKTALDQGLQSDWPHYHTHMCWTPPLLLVLARSWLCHSGNLRLWPSISTHATADIHVAHFSFARWPWQLISGGQLWSWPVPRQKIKVKVSWLKAQGGNQRKNMNDRTTYCANAVGKDNHVWKSSWVAQSGIHKHLLCTYSALTLLVGRQEGHPVGKNWVVGCWHGNLSGARYRLAYGPAYATATHFFFLQ